MNTRSTSVRNSRLTPSRPSRTHVSPRLGSKTGSAGLSPSNQKEPSMATTTRSVVLEQASQEFVDATANPPYFWEGSPVDARKVLDEVQATPIDKLPVDDRWITVPTEAGDVRVRIVRPPD